MANRMEEKMKIVCIKPICFKGQEATQPRLPGPDSGDKGKQLTKTAESKLPQDTFQLNSQSPAVDNNNCVNCAKK